MIQIGIPATCFFENAHWPPLEILFSPPTHRNLEFACWSIRIDCSWIRGGSQV